MSPKQPYIRYFLGANTPQGFVSRFDQLADCDAGWRLIIVKGGPGSGKSTLMRRVAELYDPESRDIEVIHCSSDADSVDGIICHDIKLSICDGTSPHVVEPKYPGAFETLFTINDCWDEEMLREHRADIVRLSGQIAQRHENCRRFLGAAASLLGDTFHVALDATDTLKIQRYAQRFAQKNFKKLGRTGKEQVRFISAITNKGPVMFSENIPRLCQRVYLLEDDYGASSRLVLRHLRRLALEAGYDIISCYCPLSPFDKLEHLMIPALGLGFFTADSRYDLGVAPYRVVSARRFTDPEVIRRHKKRIAFNRKAANQMLEKAGSLVAEAKELHDQLERYYIAATDFEKVARKGDALLEQIKQLRG